MNYVKSFLQKTLPDSSLVRLRALDYRMHSADECRLLSMLCDRRKSSIDIGANVGTLTYHLARYSFHTFAYEPNPQLAQRLRRAFRSKVTVVEAALSDQAGSTVLKIPFFDGVEMHGLASVAQQFAHADSIKEYTVSMERLDDRDWGDIGFVKIDVEQNEEKVLRGGMQLFAKQRPNILLEVSPKLYSKPLHEFLADLLSLGYRGYFLFDGQLNALDNYRMDVHNNSTNYGMRGKYVTNIVLTTQPLR